MISSSSVPTSWNGAFVKQKGFADKFTIVDVEYDEIMDNYAVTIIFKASPEKTYVFDVDAEKYSEDKVVLGREILRQLQNG